MLRDFLIKDNGIVALEDSAFLPEEISWAYDRNARDVRLCDSYEFPYELD